MYDHFVGEGDVTAMSPEGLSLETFSSRCHFGQGWARIQTSLMLLFPVGELE